MIYLPSGGRDGGWWVGPGKSFAKLIAKLGSLFSFLALKLSRNLGPKIAHLRNSEKLKLAVTTLRATVTVAAGERQEASNEERKKT